MQEISVEEIYDYLTCPMLYQFRHINRMKSLEKQIHSYKKALHQAIYFYYYNLMDGKILSQGTMKTKWAQLWNKERETIDSAQAFILKERQVHKAGLPVRESFDQYLMQGFSVVYNFIRMNEHREDIIPIVVNQPYRLNLDNLIVKGNFELIREKLDKDSGNRFIDIVDYRSSTRKEDPFLLKNDLNAALTSMAFKQVFNKKEDRYTYNKIDSGKEEYIIKQASDYERAKVIVQGVASGVRNKAFYPRQSFQCAQCPFQDICDRVNF